MNEIALPVYILIVIVAVMVIFAVINKFGWKSLLIIPALLLIMLVARMFVAYQRSYVEVQQDKILSWMPPQDATGAASSIWTEGIEKEFSADVYPSRQSAAQALARQTAPLLPSMTTDQTLPATVEIYGRDIPIQLLNVFADALREKNHLPNMMVQPLLPDPLGPADANQVIVVMDMARWEPQQRSFNQMALHEGSGTLRIRIKGTGGPDIVRSVEIEEKPWVHNLSPLLNQNPNAHVYVARSGEACTEQSEALQESMHAAVALVQKVIARGTASLGNTQFAINAINEQDVLQHQLIIDQFSQSFVSTVGRIWRHAVLLDLDPDKLTSLFQSRLHTTTGIRAVRQKRWIGYMGSLVGLALVVLMLYVFLNAATKGYYTWSLRIAAVILIAVFVVAILNFL